MFSWYETFSSNSSNSTTLITAAVLFVAFIVLWLFLSTERLSQATNKYALLGILGLFAITVGIYFVVPVAYVAILMVIVSAMLPHYLSIKHSFALSLVLALPLYLVFAMYWNVNNMFVTSLLFWTFNLFAIITVNTSIREREARMLAELNARKLRATQSLLNQAVEQAERTRIARNIHDLLGHHLTALTINLQVASRKSNGEVKDTIDDCHQLAKLLLSDVREAVSDIRAKSKLDIHSSILSMLEKLPQLDVKVDIDEQVDVQDIQAAEAIVKAVQETITNTLRHARGDTVSIQITQQTIDHQHQQVLVTIINNGQMPSKITIGNGLTGIKERLAELNGEATFSVVADTFNTNLSIPIKHHD